MTKTEENIFSTAGFTQSILETILPFKKSAFREYYWTDDGLFRYSIMKTEQRNYIHGVVSFLINKLDFKLLIAELSSVNNISLVQTITGVHLYDEVSYEKNDYYWNILQKLYKTELIQVSLFPTTDVIAILRAHNFKFYGATVDNEECYSILKQWTGKYGSSLKCIAIGESVDMWVSNIPEFGSDFYDDCLKISQGFLENGENWKSYIQSNINEYGSVTLYDK